MIRAISTSKMINKMPIKKNRKENGIRAFVGGSNPHSKGESFSRFNSLFLFNVSVKINKANGSNIIIREVKTINNITIKRGLLKFDVTDQYFY